MGRVIIPSGRSDPSGAARKLSGVQRVARLQAGFYVVTGLWPLVHAQSFLWVTGPKVDVWLVQTVGLLLAAFGYVLWGVAAAVPSAAWRRLAILNAAVLAAVDVVCVARGRISSVYLLDAAAEVALIAGWIVCGRQPSAPEDST